MGASLSPQHMDNITEEEEKWGVGSKKSFKSGGETLDEGGLKFDRIGKVEEEEKEV